MKYLPATGVAGLVQHRFLVSVRKLAEPEPERSIDEMKDELPEDLKLSAAILAEEIRKGDWDGQWDKSLPVPRSQRLIEELKSRIPGFSLAEYQDALAFGMDVTR